MCELMTIAASVFVTLLFFAARLENRPARALGTTSLALWGASLMWGVDCVQSFREGQGFFDLSADDAALGGVILACALLRYAVLRVREAFAMRKSAVG